MSKSSIGLGTNTSSRPTRASRREAAARVVAEVAEVIDDEAPPATQFAPADSDRPASTSDAPAAVKDDASPVVQPTLTSVSAQSAPDTAVSESPDGDMPSANSSAPAVAPTEPTVSTPAVAPAGAQERSATVDDLFERRKRPTKKPLNTYVTAATAARLERFVREHELTTTGVVDKALTRLLDEMGVPQADMHGTLIES